MKLRLALVVLLAMLLGLKTLDLYSTSVKTPMPSAFPQLAAAPAWPRLPSQDDPRLDSIATHLAMRPVHVDCPSSDDWNSAPINQGTWGWVWYGSAETHIAPIMCRGVRALMDGNESIPKWQRALGTLVLVHESGHLRQAWWSPDEGLTENFAIRHLRTVTRLLGVSDADSWDYLAYGLAFHQRLVRHFAAYDCPLRKRGCRVVPWFSHH